MSSCRATNANPNDENDAAGIVALRNAAPALIARVRELEAGLREACDLIDSGSAFCSDCDRGATAESLRALLPKETP